MMRQTSNVKCQMSKRRTAIRTLCAKSEIAWILACVVITALAALAIAVPSQAMPEYATQLGEPCATCHIGPAGGGLRTARGQAWVAQEKPGAVPSIEDSMKLLGVKTSINPADYAPAPLPRPAPKSLNAEQSPRDNWQAWLSNYDGN